MDTYGKVEKLTPDILIENGYCPVTMVGAGNVIFNKWGFNITVHCNIIFWVTLPDEHEKSITYLHELIGLEQRFNIDKTLNINNLSIEELKLMIPIGYKYILNKRIKKISSSGISFNNKRGRYRIYKDEELINEGYNDENEDYFLCRSLLYILEKENLLPKNI